MHATSRYAPWRHARTAHASHGAVQTWRSREILVIRVLCELMSNPRPEPRRVRSGDAQDAWDRHEPSKPSRTAPRGASPSDGLWVPTRPIQLTGHERPCAAGRRSRSVRRIVANPICVSISGIHSTRSLPPLGRHSALAPDIQSRHDLAR